MAQFFSFDLVILSVVAWQIFSVGGCPARCVKNGGTCSFLEPTKCCTPICLAQYQVCGKTCAAPNAACVLSNDCCVPLSCANNVCCSAVGSTCAVTSDCCSPLSCANNVCCSAVGSTCKVNSDCCSKSCNSNKVCCTAGGSTCNVNSDCCSKTCTSDKVCCADVLSFCNLNADCCSKSCVANECCIPSGTLNPFGNIQCCSKIRRGLDQVCCSQMAIPCMLSGECCSNKCMAGFCTA